MGSELGFGLRVGVSLIYLFFLYIDGCTDVGWRDGWMDGRHVIDPWDEF